MLSLSMNDALRRGAWTCIACSRSPQSLIVTAAAKHTGSKHQRNHSSSKASSSPKDVSRPLGTASEAPSNKEPAAPPPAEKRSTGRRTSRMAPKPSVAKSPQETYPNIPSVPSTQHLHPQSKHPNRLLAKVPRLTSRLDIQVASFFSRHRPISITRSFPPPSSGSQFSSIFEPRSPPKTPIGDVIYTVTSAIESLENAVFEQRPSPSGSMNSSPSSETTHLDGQPQHVTLDINELSKTFQPFVPPPPPVASDDSKSASVKRKKAVKERSWSTTLTVTEQAYPNGQKIYQTQISHMREDSPSVTTHTPSSSPAPSHQELQYADYEVIDITPPSGRQPFLERMRSRHQAWEDGLSGPKKQIWRAISVKRQRKLKMKKHKYKKLMRKTRNLRRRLDKG
ncbi:MAG: hypothetical protein Q9226_003538 [Calogaya cf. arnoldii]